MALHCFSLPPRGSLGVRGARMSTGTKGGLTKRKLDFCCAAEDSQLMRGDASGWMGKRQLRQGTAWGRYYRSQDGRMGSALKVMLRAPIFYPRCNIKSLGGLGGGAGNRWDFKLWSNLSLRTRVRNRISSVTLHFIVGTHWSSRHHHQLSLTDIYIFKPGTVRLLKNLLSIYGNRSLYIKKPWETLVNAFIYLADF